MKRIEKGKFTAEELTRIDDGVRVLREAGFTKKADLLSKSPEFQKSLLRAHYTANNIDAGQICAKSRLLRKLFTVAEQRPLFKEWVVGDINKLIRKIKAERNGHALARYAKKAGLVVDEGTEHYSVYTKSGEYVTAIGRHKELKGKELYNPIKVLVRYLEGL